MWLVTWEWAGDHAAVNEKIVAILDYRRSSKQMLQIVELLYINSTSSVQEKVSYARNRKKNPYPAKYGYLGNIPWMGEIYCGHNPYLHARRVDNLKVTIDEDMNETVSWDERPKPAVKDEWLK
ncbi:MAG TPA: hypothetical protein VH643_31980 [Gemmataceae bacterium]|jgi:hypothetical protein